ncbi:DUF4350 domain-containing protein [Occallatibacter savannae]|uniref:DUF4350 domain-containing protein n=1 Tax=Occallatibacter savannae TaxID=1002691 RepID=UPI000D69A242|nr:DUF4350 domain-containing protein [Occallatibacter savannae]
MRFMSSLDAKDRKLLLWSVGIAVGLAVVIALVMPDENNDQNPMPSTYLAGKHGARAAYETLVRSGYGIERWERPLSELAASAGPNTVVILAQPFSRETDDYKAVDQIVARGGRVLATGLYGGYLLPEGQVSEPKNFTFAACQLDADGLDALAGTGEVWMVPEASWNVGNPAQRTQYDCAGQPAVVEYDYGKGHVVWWANSTPLENAALARGADFDLLLNSIGPREGHQIYWDESLHGEMRSTWSFVGGPTVRLLWVGLILTSILIVFSFSRRSGPVRELPGAPRATPIEFLDALGSLYRSAGASSTAVSIAWERFRRSALRMCGLRQSKISADELAAAIRRRFPNADAALEDDLRSCEEAARNEKIEPREALKAIQTLHHHRQLLMAAARSGSRFVASNEIKQGRRS